MSFFVVDVEADGPYPIDYSMVCLGAVKVLPLEELNKRTGPEFYSRIAPISDKWVPDALAVSGFSREEHLKFLDPAIVMRNFVEWVEQTSVGRPILISDNNQFDGMFIAAYCHKFVGRNPFGFSSRRIGDLFCGIKGDVYKPWKQHRRTKHTHHPVDDARGNAEVIAMMKEEMGLKIKLV